MTALLERGELVLEVNARRSGLDVGLHQLEGVQQAAEAGFGVGDDRHQPVDAVAALEVVDLVGPDQGVVDALDQVRAAVRRVHALVRVGL